MGGHHIRHLLSKLKSPSQPSTLRTRLYERERDNPSSRDNSIVLSSTRNMRTIELTLVLGFNLSHVLKQDLNVNIQQASLIYMYVDNKIIIIINK